MLMDYQYDAAGTIGIMLQVLSALYCRYYRHHAVGTIGIMLQVLSA